MFQKSRRAPIRLLARSLTLRPVDRREFLRRGSMATAGVALVGGLAACGEPSALGAVSTIPCLPAVAAPSGAPGMTYIRASEIGCALNCDLSTGNNIHGSGPATDDAPKINAALAGATAANPLTLIIDGAALISGLFLPPGGHWSIAGLGCGTGFFVKTGANNDGIHNAGPQQIVLDPGPSPPTRGSGVSLTDFTLNVNQGDGHSGDSTSGSPLGGTSWYFGINLINLDNITITNVVVVNSPTYHIRLSNVGNVSITGCVLHSIGPHTDGLHFDGPANDIAIANCDFTLQDDAIALNAPEGYSGDIQRVAISNCTFNSFRVLRLESLAGTGNPSFHVSQISMTGCSGTATAEAIILGNGNGATAQSVDAVTISGCTFSAPALLELAVNFGSVTVSNTTWTPSGPLDVGYALARTSQYDSATTYTGSSLTLQSCTITRQSGDPVAALILSGPSTLGVLEINGLSVVDPAGSSFAPSPQLVNIVAGTITQLGLDGVVSPLHLAAPVSPGAFASIGSIAGAGVLATGWKFPDSVMANGSPYLSATTGQPSIKVAGVVQPYP